MVGFSIGGSSDRAQKMLHRMIDPKYVKFDKAIPATLIKHCEGIAFVTIVKAGLFFLGGNFGGGVVIAKVKDPNDPRGWRWSGPSSIVCGGLGGGFIFGGEKIDSIIILNTKSAVRAFMGDKQVTFGGNLSIAAGPVGRDLEGHVGLSDTKEIVAAYSYSQAQGAIIAATLEGAFVSSSRSNNAKFYGRDDATPELVLTGGVGQIPLKGLELAREIDNVIARKGSFAAIPASNNNIITPTQQQQQQQQSIAKPHEVIADNGRKLLNAGLSGEEDLPPGWETADAENGLTYYFNRALNVTQWDKPAHPAMISRPKAPPPPPKVAARPVPPRREFATAIYDYTAQQPDELSFRKDDRIQLLDKSDANWWKAEVSGKSGLIPSNYVKL